MEKELISVKDFSPEELRKWQLKLLDILIYFRDFCEEHGLKFMLAAGTCLGAVRHNGFIPWDDDLDVQMPREDYDKLVGLWDKYADKSRFRCERTDENRSVMFPMTVVRSVNTTCIYDHSVNKSDICQGLKIDVEFLDGVPDEKWKKVFNKACAMMLALLRTERPPQREPLFYRVMGRFLLFILPTHKIRWTISNWCEKQIKKFKFGTTQYVRYLSCALRPSKSFEKIIYVDFEGYKMPIPEGYDQMLRAAYGDYMQLPPEDKRTPATDNLVFYDLDHSYLDYKGKYYCVEK